MAQKNSASNRASETGEKERARGAADTDCPPPAKSENDFEPTIDLPGKTDSGPEPDVFPVTGDP